MKRIFAIATAAVLGAAAFAGSASAQAVNGTVDVTGNVTAACYVGTPSTTQASSFSDTMALGEIDNTANGTLLSTLASATPVAAAIKTFTVTCNGSDATVTLSATRFSTGSGTAPAGYSRNIDYTAELDAALVAGGPKVLTYATAAVLPGATSSTLGARLANTAGDITVKAYSFHAENGALSVLEAGGYGSTITVSITPIT
jgi:hypothetical protein